MPAHEVGVLYRLVSAFFINCNNRSVYASTVLYAEFWAVVKGTIG